MKKLLLSATVMMLMFALVIPSVSANTAPQTGAKKVTLTQEQKEEMAKLHREVFEKKKQVISKYVEYGVLTEEKGNFILEKMDAHLKELEQNDYIPKWDRHKHPHPHHK